MPFTAPSVVVIIAAYNAGTTIQRAIWSALAEPETVEVIVVDDASNDDTLAQAAAADDGSGRLHLIPLATNAGPAAARNYALDHSVAPWVTILDADDFLSPGAWPVFCGLPAMPILSPTICGALPKMPSMDSERFVSDWLRLTSAKSLSPISWTECYRPAQTPG